MVILPSEVMIMFRKSKDSDTGGQTALKRFFTVALACLAWPGAFLRRGWGKFYRIPRVYKLVTVYCLAILSVAGLFIWRASSLRLQFPYSAMEEPLPDRYEYLWEKEAPGQRNESAPTAGMEPQAEQSEMVHAPQPSSALADSPTDSLFQEAAVLEPPALWPVEGELRYLFWDPVSVPLIPSGNQYRYSRGVSIRTEPGAAVRAVWNGVVRRVAEVDYPYGASITISHAGGLESYYGALRNVQVSTGDSVRQGQVLARVAPGDGSEPASLYLEIWDHQRAVDPLLYLSEK